MNDRLLSFLGLCRRAGKLTMGAQPVRESIEKGRARLVLYAEDFSENSLKSVLMSAESKGVKTEKISRSKEELGFALGKMCGVLAVEDEGFADKIRTLIEQNA